MLSGGHQTILLVRMENNIDYTTFKVKVHSQTQLIQIILLLITSRMKISFGTSRKTLSINMLL